MAAPNMITIETRRMILRAAEQEDAIALHQIMSDAETMRFWYTFDMLFWHSH